MKKETIIMASSKKKKSVVKSSGRQPAAVKRTGTASGRHVDGVDERSIAVMERPVAVARRAVKESATLDAISAGMWEGDKPEKGIGDYLDAFGAYTWVYAAVFAIATAAASVPYILYRKREDGDLEEVMDHPLLDLLASPSARETGRELTERSVAQEQASGNAFWELVRDRYGTIREIHTLNPRNVKIKDDSKVGVAAYEFEVNGKKIDFKPDDVVHFRLPDPNNDFWGMSPLAAARKALVSERNSIRWNQAFFDNSARPDVLFTTQDALGERAFRRLVSRVKQMFRGARRAHSAYVGDGGLKVEKLGFAPKDVEFLQLRKFSRDEILAVYGVPPVMVGVFESAIRANAEVQEHIFWTTTMVNYLARREMVLNQAFLPRTGRKWTDEDDGLVLKYDLTTVPALGTKTAGETDKLVNQVGSGIISRNEARYELGYETLGPDLDRITVGGTLTPVAMAGEQGVDGLGNIAGPELRVVFDPGSIKLLNADYRLKVWKAVDERREPFVSRTREDWKRLFRAIDEDVRERLRRLAKHKARKYYRKAISVEAVFAEQTAADRARDVLELELEEVVRTAGNYAMLELAIELGVNSDEFSMVAPEIRDYIRREAFDKSRTIMETMKGRLRGVLDAAFEREASLREIEGLLSDWLTGTKAEPWIETIARTEIGSGYSRGNREAARQVIEGNPGVNLYKVWLSVRDANVRATHAANDRQTQETPLKFDQTYPANGLMHPHDPAGGAEEVINCFLPGTLVSGKFIGGSKAWYSGKAVEIETKSGRRVSTTINHPIFTARGWVRAGEVKESDYAVCQIRDVNEFRMLGDVDDKDRPRPIEDVFNSMVRDTGRQFRMVRALDFHGDGGSMLGEIEIIGADGFLWNEFDSGIGDGVEELSFERSAISEGPFFSDSFFDSFGIGGGSGSSSNPRGVALADDKCSMFLDRTPFKPFCVGLATNWDVCVDEVFTDSGSRDSGLFRKFFDASSGNIAFDKVVKVRYFDFSGHVYDLQSTGGWLIAGGLLYHNCRCNESYVSGTLIERKAGLIRYRKVRTTDGVVRMARRIGMAATSTGRRGDVVLKRIVDREVRRILEEKGALMGNGRN